jgi:putative transposase
MNALIRGSIASVVSEIPAITLAELLRLARGATAGDVFEMIANNEVYVDLSAAWLGDEDRVQVFPHRESAKFFQCFSESQVRPDGDFPRITDLIPGTTLTWNGVPAEIVNVGKTEITIYRSRYKDYPSFPSEQFERWMREGRITDFRTRPRLDRESEAYRLAQRLENRAELAEALWRYNNIIKPRLEGEPVIDETLTDRTHRNIIASYKRAEADCGNGLLGLVPRHHKKGNGTDRLMLIDPRLRGRLDDFIDSRYERPGYPTKTIAYGEFRNECAGAGIRAPSYKTFISAIKRRATAKQAGKMEGSKVAYQLEEWLDWEEGIPVHGDRPWEYAHLDHTVVDVVLRHTDKGVIMGKAWVTLLIDSCTRVVLAYYLSYDCPSYRSCMGVIRECVRLRGQLPECFVVDGGSEFRCVYFEKLLARYRCDVVWRPPTKPRFGAVIERFIHTMNQQIVHNLEGNTKIMKKARQVTKEVNPESLALWDFPALDEELERYFYEEYANRMHSGLGESPREAFERGMAKFSLPGPEPIKYDDDFLIDTMASTLKGTAKLHRSRGIKIFGVWYRSKKLRRADLYGRQLEVRYDSWNMAHAYVSDGDEWVVCYAPPDVYAKLKNRTEREVRMYTEERRQLHRVHGRGFNARAEDLAERKARRDNRAQLRKQQLKDAEARESAERRGRRLSPGSASDVSAHGQAPANADSGGRPAAAPAGAGKLLTFNRAMKARRAARR